MLTASLQTIHDALGAAGLTLSTLTHTADPVERCAAARSIARSASLAAEEALRIAEATGSESATVAAERCVEGQVASATNGAGR